MRARLFTKSELESLNNKSDKSTIKPLNSVISLYLYKSWLLAYGSEVMLGEMSLAPLGQLFPQLHTLGVAVKFVHYNHHYCSDEL